MQPSTALLFLIHYRSNTLVIEDLSYDALLACTGPKIVSAEVSRPLQPTNAETGAADRATGVLTRFVLHRPGWMENGFLAKDKAFLENPGPRQTRRLCQDRRRGTDAA